MMTRVKFCGLTHRDDVAEAVESGADALGFVFYESSSRYVTPEQASELTRIVPALITRVGLFVDADAALVQGIFHLSLIHISEPTRRS